MANPDEDWPVIEGEIVRFETPDGSSRALPVVAYSVDGKDYLVYNSETNSDQKLGSMQKIAYDPNDPDEAVVLASDGWRYMGYGSCLS